MFLEEKETKLKYVELRRGGGGGKQTFRWVFLNLLLKRVSIAFSLLIVKLN